jgi:transposase
MLGLSTPPRILMSTEPTDMRKGPDGLCALVKRQFDESVFSGTLFVFLSRRRDRAKILWWSHGGFIVYYKRLEKSRFRRPDTDNDGRLVLSPGELQALLEGIDLRRARRAPLWEPTRPVA